MALSRKYHKPLGEIAKANNIEPHTMVKVGDRIVIPGVRATQAAAEACRRRWPQQPKPAAAPKVAAVPGRARADAQRRDGDARRARARAAEDQDRRHRRACRRSAGR